MVDSVNRAAATPNAIGDLPPAVQQKISDLPGAPGCYLMKDKRGKIFYIGKASHLRNRVRSYFSGGDTRQFVFWLSDILFDLDIIVVRNEKEALLLERTLIREHKPRFNVLLQDDKNFIHLRLFTRKKNNPTKKRDQFPKLEVVRNPKKDGARYFGPYHSASSVRTTLKIANRFFQLRTCSDHVLENRTRPCLQYQIGRCPAPCVYDVPNYMDRVSEVGLFLGGNTKALLKKLEARMWEAAQSENYETAAYLRDQIQAVQTSFDSQAVAEVNQQKDQAVFAVSRSGPFLEIAYLSVRAGLVVAKAQFSFEKQEFPTEHLFFSFLSQYMGQRSKDDIPDEVLVPFPAEEDCSLLSEILKEKKGKNVRVFFPQRGTGKKLLEIARKNSDRTISIKQEQNSARQLALRRLQHTLRLPHLPNHIECFDISLFQGTDAVGSQVTFIEGAKEKKQYRRYTIKTVEGTDDFAMIYEVIKRRLRRAIEHNHFPDLLLIDGGKGQLNAALAACKDLDIFSHAANLRVASVAKARAAKHRQNHTQEKNQPALEKEKTEERIFLPGVKDPIILRPHTQDRFLVERLRDEAHRFAVEGHRKMRKRRTIRSQLDDIPNIGAELRKTLLRHFGSVRAVRAASIKEIQSVPGIGPKRAQTIYEHLQND